MMRPPLHRHAALAALAALAACACAHDAPVRDLPGEGSAQAPARTEPASCPATAPSEAIPGTRPEHLRLETWEALLGDAALDEVLLTEAGVRAHNAATGRTELGHTDLLAPVDDATLRARIAERLDAIGARVDAGEYLGPSSERLTAPERDALRPPDRWPALRPEWHTAQALVPVRCTPRAAGLFRAPVDRRFDRNNCSTVHPGEVVRVLARWPGGLMLAQTPYTQGWISSDAALSPPLDAAAARRALERPVRPLTRRAILEAAFALLGTPYGWGGEGGGLDCSRFLMSVFASVGLELPRFSLDQARSGTFSIDLTGVESERERLLLIDAAARRGVVLLYMPGHIMLYLGRDSAGAPMALHSFAEYLVPCPGGGETLFTTDGVTVTGLELGRDSSRTAFIQRITRVVVLGGSPGPELVGAAELRDAAPSAVPPTCDDGPRTSIRFSPLTPNAGQPLRLMISSYRELAPVGLTLTTPRGETLRPALRRLGGPPWTWVATLPEVQTGDWTAVFGDGGEVWACSHFKVVSRARERLTCTNPPPGEDVELAPEDADPVWRPNRAWGPRTEALFSAFVESLFDYPLDEDLTWPDLTTLLRDPERNLFFDHFGRDEEASLRFQPDCADLPYFLRAYYAWKMGLPFAFRSCGRGTSTRAPGCGEMSSNAEPCSGDNGVEAFERFVRRSVASGVHSGHGRTGPEQDATDYYPVPLTRLGLRPGTIYADPYGHVMIVARWVPQGTERYGVLLAADAQPDGTIGRRRFWRGTFLFDPDTTASGAGFKAFRPVRWRGAEPPASLPNRALAEGVGGFTPFSMEQYEGTADDFYDRVEALINPRPLDPRALQTTLVEALDESLQRRVNSVQNGEDYKRDHGGTIPMPDGHSIFETEGAWEDYSTPSRDMRLLIAMDTVLRFPDGVARKPERYGLTPGPEAEREVAALREHLARALGAHSVTYVRSDGSPWKLTLAELARRAEALEMAYNPNDCVEIRWGAPEGSEERAPCRAHAPAEQRRKMERYRSWFADRKRPPR
ncbi:MAG: C40 family peptidase [Deltaproteobacteria bacterium]|nr:C40 family peptidase [Deltaproteobacteria bacterium]MCB9787490.1 C40 family peptidase [Deltaproteobacteria bacterium]